MESTREDVIVRLASREARWFTAIWRPLRFGMVGLMCAAAQLAVLDTLLDIGWAKIWANGVALLVGMNLSFVLHSLFTWRDQRIYGLKLLRRWGRFLVTQVGTLLLNQAIFLIALNWLPALVASMVGSLLVTGLNYLLGQHLIFKPDLAAPPVEDRSLTLPT